MTQISKEYASALFELAGEEKKEQDFLSALKRIENLLSEEYIEILSSPNIPLRERRSLLENAFSGEEEYVLSFVQLLCEKGHLSRFSEILREYEALTQALSHTHAARIFSAVELTESEKEKLILNLNRRMNGTVLPAFQIDESLIGGLVVEIDGRIIDGSVRHRLNEVKEGLAK